MVRLMKMALGLNEKNAEAFLSPSKLPSKSRAVVDDEYETIEVEEIYV